MGIEGHQLHLPKSCDQVLATLNDLGDAPERPIEIVEDVLRDDKGRRIGVR